MSRLLSYYFKRNLYRYFLVETDSGIVLAHFLHALLEGDELAVHVVSQFLKSFGNLDAVDRAEDSAGRACLCSDGERDVFEGGSSGFSVGFELGELVGLLALVLSENLRADGVAITALPGE